MAFMLGKHLVFIDSPHFMSSNLDKLVNNLPNDAFKYTSEDIKNDKKLKLMKQKVYILMIIWIHLTDLVKRNYQIKTIFTAYETMNIYLRHNMYMQSKYGRHLS